MPAVQKKPIYDASQNPYPKRMYRPGEKVGVTVRDEEEETAFVASLKPAEPVKTGKKGASE